MKLKQEENLFRANQERAEAQKGQELVSEAGTIPRGLDYNLPNADMSAAQENVIAASDKAASQVKDLRASASAREANAHEAGAGIDKIAAARNVARQHLGGSPIVTSAAPGRTYSGKIIGILGGPASPDKSAVMAISKDRAILHDIRRISAETNLKAGDEVNLAVDGQGYSSVQSRGQKTDERKRERSREGIKR